MESLTIKRSEEAGSTYGGSPGTAKGESGEEPQHGGGIAQLTLVAPDLFLRTSCVAVRILDTARCTLL